MAEEHRRWGSSGEGGGSGPPAPASGVQRHCFALLSKTLPRRRPGHPSTPHLLLFSDKCRPTPHPNQSSFPLLSVGDSTVAASPSPVVPVWGLAIVHRLGALGVAWSTYESHRKRTVHGEPDGWDPRGPWPHARKVPPYYAGKKCFLHLTAGTHRQYLRTEGSASLLCENTIPPDDSWDPADLVADLWAY